MRRVVASLWFAVALGLYVGSFFLPVAGPVLSDSEQRFSGGQAFLFCFRHAFEKINPDGLLAFIGWLANPVMWLGLGSCVAERWRAAELAGVIALALGVAELGLFWGLIWGNPGYWEWLASFAALFLAARQARPSPDDDV